jgi:hypothetical protein
MGCPYKADCALYGRSRSTNLLQVWMLHYCDGAYSGCERQARFDAGEPVSDSLLPNGQDLRELVGVKPSRPPGSIAQNRL